MLRDKACDVVVVGSGGAGLRAAISAAQEGAHVIVVCRGKANRSGSTLLAGANISADIACDGATLARLGISDALADDTPAVWFDEVVHEGFHLNNQTILDLFVTTAGLRVEELVSWGLKVQGMEGDREISVFGSDILDVLYARACELGVEFFENRLFTDVLTSGADGGRACGVTYVDLADGEVHVLPASAVVLCTGGAHGLFPASSGPTDLCGEGQAAALRAGAELVDMEMVSFCPTVVTHPTMYRGSILPYILITTGYGQLVNRFGRQFHNLPPRAEQLALYSEWNKMLLSYSEQLEMDAGRSTRHGGLYFTLPSGPREVIEELYAEIPQLKRGIYAEMMGILESGGALVVQPAAHYFEGGVHVRSDMSTALPGLFAAGECAGGLFGASRVSAATTEMLVEGAVAGVTAACFAKDAPSGGELDQGCAAHVEEELLAPFGRTDGPDPVALVGALRETTGGAIGVIRNGIALDRASRGLADIAEALGRSSLSSMERRYNQQWRSYMELRAMLPCAQAIVASSMERQESRGVFVRSDCPNTDNEFCLFNVLVTPDGSTLRKSVELVRAQPERGVWSYQDYIQKTVDEMD